MEKVFSGFCKSEIMDFDSLPPHVQIMIEKTFYAGAITAFNLSDSLMESILIGKNADIMSKARGDDPIRFVIMECDTKIGAQKIQSDFEIFQRANAEYKNAIEESRIYAKEAMRSSQQNSTRRKAEKESQNNVYQFKHDAPETKQ